MRKLLLFLMLVLIVGCNAGMKELSCCTQCIQGWDGNNGEYCINQDYDENELSKFCKRFFEENDADEEYCRQRWSNAK